ncbi:UNVERIFIED_CONTAM: hypothetical protein Sradi_7046000 [Sesamum radiatum]|uniref:Reverse transcriptase domain-containing protein n=1 Tax=Sesamum radiatum TaxID=300843 RepID=A0AAW2J9J6_SESRA
MIQDHEQFLHLKVNPGASQEDIFCTFVYAKCYRNSRRLLWDELTSISNLHAPCQTEWNLPIEGYGMYKLQQKIYRTKELLKRWNREVFGNVFTTVEHAKQEAEEAEKNFDRDPSEANLVALNKCNAALVHALSLESEYWRQKSNLLPVRTAFHQFFQKCWDFIKNDIQEAVRDFFCGTPMPRSFKATTIVLIPKVESPQTWSDFRPISLCNVTNKILSKLLYKKLSLSLPNLISPSQSGFVTGRFLSLIKHAIKDCWFTVLVNGETAGFFKSTRGLRQGDPISPALFIIAAEALSKGIDHLFNGNPDMYFQAKCEVKISHLSYADDVIIFTNCKEAGLLRLMNFLRKFEEQSGQQINQAKSAFIPGRKANLIANRIKNITGFSMKALPITYLGAPLYKGNKRKVLYENLIDKVRNRISGWENCHLSYGGRLLLIKTVLSSMPIYLLQVLNPPVSTIQKLERLFARFFWGSTTEQRKNSLD